ncbi:zinc carboxypeptidase [Novymonas esmeraldas]|uniref:Zinc carboxypeptidase n=1 Tax=Novymonas esmeraldas TaxID=1808958 RepID=A0AAW0F2Z1_9TRYP
MSRSQETTRREAAQCVRVPPIATLPSSAVGSTGDIAERNGTPRQRQRAAQRLAAPQQHPQSLEGCAGVAKRDGHPVAEMRDRVGRALQPTSGSASVSLIAGRTPASSSSSPMAAEATVPLTRVKSRAANVGEERVATAAPSRLPPQRTAAAARIAVQRPVLHSASASPRVAATSKVCPTTPPPRGATDERVTAPPASTSPPPPASPAAGSPREARSRGPSEQRSSSSRLASPAALHSPRPHTGTGRGSSVGNANTVASCSTNSHGSARSLRYDTPNSITIGRPRQSVAAAPPPAQQLLEDGYYLASDESANSSFSDTPMSTRRISLGSSSSMRTAMQPLDLNGGGGGGRAAGMATRVVHGPRDSRVDRSSRGRDALSKMDSGFLSLDGQGDDDAGAFDESDEEQAVLTYMDAGTEGGHAARLPSATHAPPPPPPLSQPSPSTAPALARHESSSYTVSASGGAPLVLAGPRDGDGSGAVSDGACGGDPPHHSGTAAPPPPPPPQCRHATPSPHRPASGPRATAAPTRLSRQQSAVNGLPPSHHSPPLAVADPPPLMAPPPLHLASSSSANEEELRDRQCKLLSLHDAFFANQSRSVWLVDDHVLAKVLEYVRIMGYEHPALRRDRAKSQSSLWSSSSAVASPIALGKSKKKSAAAAPADGLARSGSADPSAQPPPPAAAATAAAGGRQYHLKAGKPRCAGQYVNTSSTTAAAHLFLTFSEAMRWIAEQEYVIGTVLLCCARFVGDADADGAAVIGDGVVDTPAWHPRRAMLQRGKPCIPLRCHPIHFVASLACSRFPHWGGMSAFVRAWETQIRLVLGSASPSHQRLFKCPDDGLLMSSDCEAGNLHRVERAAEPYFFLIWLDPDQGSDKRIWFRFSVTGAREGRTLRFRLMNAAPHLKLYRQNGMTPVWRDGLSQTNWGPVDSCSFRTTNRDFDGELSFSITARNSTETIQVAFCAPYTYADLLCHICHWHALVKTSGCDMRFDERVLCNSPEGRKLHLLIITSRIGGAPMPAAAAVEETHASHGAFSSASGRRDDASGEDAALTGVANGSGGSASSGTPSPAPPGKGKAAAAASASSASAAAAAAAQESVRGPYASFASGKKVVLISGRVHPGEVTASHGVHGLISFLLSSDVRAIQLREHFIFFIVPMLNPDGVSRGHSRMDQYGHNLNRCYNDPDAETQPTVLALRRVFEHLQHTYRERFIMYLDFHSHASQSSGFIFGNNLPTRVQHWNLLFPRLVELHARHVFSFGLCRFGRVHMTSKDGASRVLFGSSLIHSYTVELTHFTDRRLYADDYTAMNNGSSVLHEVTWPPPPASGIAGGADGGADGGSTQAAAACATTPAAAARGLGRRSGSLLAGSRAAHRSNSESAGTRARGGSPSRHASSLNAAPAARRRADSTGANARRGDRGAASTAGTVRTAAPTLQPISLPCVLCQSAEVGVACLLALRDYCSIGARPSLELTMVGGMERVLRDAKRLVKSDTSRRCKKSQSAATYAGMHPIYKQY